MEFLRHPIAATAFKTCRITLANINYPSVDFLLVCGIKNGVYQQFKNPAVTYTGTGFTCSDILIDLDYITSILVYTPNGGTNYNIQGSFTIILGNGVGNDFIGSYILRDSIISILGSSDAFKIDNVFDIMSALKTGLASTMSGSTGFYLDASSGVPYLITKATFTLTTGAGTTSIILGVRESANATAIPIIAQSFTVAASTTYYVNMSIDVPSAFIAGNLIGLPLARPLYNSDLNTFFGITSPSTGDTVSNKALFGLQFNNRNFYKLGLNQ